MFVKKSNKKGKIYILLKTTTGEAFYQSTILTFADWWFSWGSWAIGVTGGEVDTSVGFNSCGRGYLQKGKGDSVVTIAVSLLRV
jgi:hypothetical protein